MQCKGVYNIKVDIQYWILDNKEKSFTHTKCTHKHTHSPFPEALIKYAFICQSCTYKNQKAKLNGQRYFPIKNVIQNTVKAFFTGKSYTAMSEWMNESTTQ